MQKITLILVALLVITGLALGQVTKPVWIPVDGNSTKPMPIQVKVLSQNTKEIKLEIRVPGYLQSKMKIDDTTCLLLHIPECAKVMERGFPLVPLFAKSIKVRENCELKLTVVEKEFVEFKLAAPIVPSKGHFTRNIPESAVSYEFGDIYKQDMFWPEEKDQFSIGEPFMFRDVCGVALKVLPISANHVQMKMQVLKRAVVVITHEGAEVATIQSTPQQGHSKTFKRMYQDFAGYEEPPQYTIMGTPVPPESNKKLVVITPTDFEGLLGDWVNWKRQCGYTVTVKSFASGTSASTIKTYLQGLYDNINTRPGYVVLVGDASSVSETATPMPTFKGKYESAATDRVYVRLAGTDNYPDAFISRLSGTSSEITNQLNKSMAYEKGTTTGAWLTQGICIASDQGSPTDKVRAEWLQNGGGNDQKVPVVAGGLIGYGYTKFTDIYDPSASSSLVTSAVNAGASIICYIGHGSSTSWGTTGFSVSHVNALSNGGQLPVIFSVACVNGAFANTACCFAEAWLRKANGGAVAMEAASTNEAWVPPCDKQAASVNAIINKTHFTFGAVEAVGTIRGLEVWGDTDKGQGNQMAEQCNLFGDCTLLMRTKQPTTIQANFARGLDSNVIVNVTTEDRAMPEASVTIYSPDFSVMVTGDTDENGDINLPLPEYDGQLYYTIVGPDIIPIIDQPLQ